MASHKSTESLSLKIEANLVLQAKSRLRHLPLEHGLAGR